jgi:hypothetical protein
MPDANKPGEKPKLIIEGDWKAQAQAEKQKAAASEQKLSVDQDWKAQAQAEKQKLAEKIEDDAEAAEAQAQLPPADFRTLASTLVSQSLLYMGAIPDPMTGQRMLHLDYAKHHIDLLGVLETKTKGNLDAEEEKMLTQSLSELRAAFVQLTKQVADHLAKQQAAGGQPGLGTGGGGMSGGSGPIRAR